MSATVSAIPITATVVVTVVAVAIATPLEYLAFSIAFLGHRRRIAALTLLAVTILVLMIRAFAIGRDGRCVICRRRLCVAVGRGIATPAIVFVAENRSTNPATNLIELRATSLARCRTACRSWIL